MSADPARAGVAFASRLAAHARLVRLERPAGWLLLLWPTWWGLWQATGATPAWREWGLFLAGAFLTRCFGCCVNDIADRKLDAQVQRTRNRPLASGAITVAEAVVTASLCLAGCLALWLQLGATAKAWALGALLLAATYPLAKRVTDLPQLHLGVAFGMGIPVAYAHVTGSVPWTAGLLMLANLCWVFAYDTIYAMVDRQDDIVAGNRSSAIWLGERDLSWIGFAYFCMLMLLIIHAVVVSAGLGAYLACGLGFGMAYVFCRRIRNRDRGSCMRVFTQNQWLGALVWLGFVADSVAR